MKAFAIPIRLIAIAISLIPFAALADSQDPPVRILPLGDSLTSGLSTSPVQGAYRNRLHSLLTAAGYSVDFIGTLADDANPDLPDRDHQGLGSARIDQIRSQFSGWIDATGIPDVVLLLVGTNDFWQGYDVANAAARLESLIADIAIRCPHAKVIVSTLPLRTDSALIEAQQSSFNRSIPNIVLRQSALGRQVTMVDLHPALTAADINGDGVHPNATGFRKMAEAWFPAITSVISPKGTANPPVISQMIPPKSGKPLQVVFSKPVANESIVAGNFTLSGGISVTGATLDASTKRIVSLTTGPIMPGVVYQIRVSGVHDRTSSQTSIAPESMAEFMISPIVNGGFEQAFDGWTTFGNVDLKSAAPYSASEGSRIAAFNSSDSTPNGWISQEITTTPGTMYEVGFDLAAIGFNTAEQAIELVVQGTSVLVSETFNVRASGAGVTRWSTKIKAFTADSNTTVIRFRDVSNTSASIDLVLDHVRVGASTGKTLAVTSSPASGASFTLAPADLIGQGDGIGGMIRRYANNTTVTLTSPLNHLGLPFLRWQRNGVDLPGSRPELTVSMESDITLAAVYGTNQPPNAADDVYSTTAGKTLTVPARGVLANDEDPENGTLSAVIQSTTPNGSITLDANGGFTYTPTAGFIGTDSFSYRVSDGVLFSDVATASIVVRDTATPGIDNGGFEEDFTGWTRSGSVTVQTQGSYLPSEGSKLAAFNAGQQPPNGVLSRMVTAKAGADHVLSFDMATYAFNTSTQRLEVRIDGATTAISKTFTLTGTANGSIRWSRQTIPFTAQSSSVTITFRDVSATTSAIDLLLDRVQVDEVIQERNLSIDATPFSGVSIAISPPGNNATSQGATPFIGKYPEGTIVNLSAPNIARGGPFLKWLRNGETYSNERHVHLDIQANVTLTAVYGSNPAPNAAADTYHLPSGIPFTVPAPGVLANDSDPDGDPISAILDTAPTRGQLLLQSNGGFTYTPEIGFSGTDSFTYRASDGQSTSEPTTVTLHVAALAPGVLKNGSFESGETGWSITGNRIVVTSTAPYLPTDGGKLLVMNGGQTQPNAVLTQRFATLPGQTYQLDLHLGIVGSNTAEQRLKVELIGSTTLRSVIESIRGIGTSKASWSSKKYAFIADSSETTLRLSDVSTSTSAVDLLLDNIRLATGNATALTVDASLSGVDINIDPPDLVGQTSGTTRFSRFYPSGSIVSLTAPTVHGAGRFVKWTLNGIDHDTQNTTRLTIGSEALSLTAIYAVNQPPTAVADRYECEREQLLTVTAPGVLQNDVDLDSDLLQAELVETTAHGSLSLSPDGGFTYQPDPGFIGNDRFTYRANDGGLSSPPVTVTLEVNDFASGNLVNGSFEEGETGWTISGNRVISGTSAPYIPTDGAKLMVANGGNVTPNAVISQTFATSVGKTYLIQLDMGVVGGVGAQQSLRINIDGKTQLLSQFETVTSTSASRATWVSKSFSFVADGDSATLSLLDQSSSGNLRDLLIDNVRCSIRLDRTLIVSSSPVDGLTVSASPADMNGNGSGITRFTRTYDNGSSVLLTAPATAGDLPFLRWERSGSLIERNREITILMDRDQDVTAVYGINRAPVAADDSYQTVQDTPLTISSPGVLSNDADPDGDPITAELGSPPTHGTINLNANGGLIYTPSAGFTGVDSFTYRVSDGVLASAYRTVIISIRSAPKDYLTNGSFEQQTQGWTVTGNHLVTASNATYLASDEASLIVLNAGQTVPNAVLSQTIATTPGTSYVLAFDMGAIGTSGLNQRLEAGITGSSSRILGTEAITAIGSQTAVWSTKSFTFTADATETTITLSDRSTTGTNVDLLLDNVRVVPVGTHTLVIDGPNRGTAILGFPADLQRNLGGITRLHRYYAPQTNVAIEAPAEHQGRPFQKWTIGSTDHAFTRSTTLVMDRDQVLTAVYESLPELLINGSFEDALTGWIRTGNADVRGTSPYLATDGKQLLGFNTAQSTPNGIISQTVPTVPGGVYQLSFDAGALGYNTQFQKLEVTATGNASLLSRTVSIQGTGNGSIRWLPQTFSFTADSNSAILRFRDTSSTTSSIDLLLDKVRLTGPPVRHQVTIASAPVNGLTIGINLADADGLTGGETPLTRTYSHGTNVTLEAPVDADGIPFSRWTKNGAFYSSNRSTTATIDGSHSFTAVFAANSIPVATPDDYAVNHNTALEVPSPGVLANDTDAEAAPLTARLTSPPANGSLTLNADGSFRYLPRTGFEGEDSFAYVASDGIADSTTSIVTLRVAPAPIILFTNGSFESGLAGWTTAGSAGTVKVKTTTTATDGANCIEFNSGNTPLDGSLSQGFTTTPGVTYTARFDMGVISFNTSSQRIQITAIGNKTLADQTFSLAGISGGKTNWSTRNVSFVADSKFTTITFRDRSLTGSALDLLLDKVSVTSSDPSAMRSLNVIADPSATIAIGVTPTDQNGIGTGATPLSLTYPNGTEVTLTAPASANGFPFVKWLRNGADHSTSPTTSVRMDADQTMTAVYSTSGPPTGSAFTNGSFESGLTGWTASGSSQAVKVNTKITGTNGSSLIAFNSNNSPTDGAVMQTFATLPGATYQVRFDMGVLAFNTQQQKMDAIVSGIAPITTKSYSMNGVGGGTVKWTNQTFRFVADGSTATLSFRDRSSTTTSIDLLLDHVRVSMVSPAGAGADLIANGSFENDFSGWNVTGSTGIEMYGTSAATHGSKLLSFNVGNLPSGGTASQSFNTVPGTTYWIGYDVAANGLEPKTASVQLTIRGTTQLLSRSTSVIGPNNYRINWSAPQSSTFVADSTRTTVTFTDTTVDGGGVDLLLDWVRVHPLPASTIIAPAASADAGSAIDAEPSAITESVTTLDPPTLQGVPGDMRIIAHVPLPGIYVLETSIDLEHWVPQQEIHAESSGVIEFEDRQPARARLFYRIAKK